MTCFHKGPLVLRHALDMWMLYFSHFFSSFFIVIRRICLPAKVRKLVFIICSLLVGIDCVTDKLKVTFSWMKNTPFCPQISPQNAENRILGLWNFDVQKIFVQEKIVWSNLWEHHFPFSDLVSSPPTQVFVFLHRRPKTERNTGRTIGSPVIRARRQRKLRINLG